MTGAGMFNRRVQFRRATASAGPLGEVETWEDIGGPLPAQRIDASDRERWRAAEVAAQIDCRFTLRWSAFVRGITPRDRLISDGRTYDITGLRETGGMHRLIEISAVARADQ